MAQIKVEEATLAKLNGKVVVITGEFDFDKY